MRFIRYLFLAAVALVLVSLAISNSEPVTLRLMPDALAAQFGVPQLLNEVTLPLFAVILGGILIGVLLGYLAEWLREHRYRAEAKRGRRETERLTSELKRMKQEKAQGDDVLALLDDAEASR
jgi:uncharacterized integral membrane protein